MTTEGGSTYTSDEFRNCMQKFGVHHFISSVGFPHGNFRAKVAVKTTKCLLRDRLNTAEELDKSTPTTQEYP